MSNIITDFWNSVVDTSVKTFNTVVDKFYGVDREEEPEGITGADILLMDQHNVLERAAPMIRDELERYDGTSPTLEEWLRVTEGNVTVSGRNKPDSFFVEYQNDKDGPQIPVIHIENARKANFNDADTGSEMTGTAGNDRLTGTDYNDLIKGRAGNDVINGRNGDDYIVGGGGKDTIKGGSGDDTIVADGGKDRIFGNNGDDTIVIQKGGVTIKGGEGADTYVIDGSAKGGAVKILDFNPKEDTIVFDGVKGEPTLDITIENENKNARSFTDAEYVLGARDVKIVAENSFSSPGYNLIAPEIHMEYEGRNQLDDFGWIQFL